MRRSRRAGCRPTGGGAGWHGTGGVGGWSHNLEWQVAAGLDFLSDQTGKEEPFCLYFSTNVIHGPEHAANTKGRFRIDRGN